MSESTISTCLPFSVFGLPAKVPGEFGAVHDVIAACPCADDAIGFQQGHEFRAGFGLAGIRFAELRPPAYAGLANKRKSLAVFHDNLTASIHRFERHGLVYVDLSKYTIGN